MNNVPTGTEPPLSLATPHPSFVQGTPDSTFGFRAGASAGPSDRAVHTRGSTGPVLGHGTGKDANPNTEDRDLDPHGHESGMFTFIYVLPYAHISRQNAVCLQS